MYRAKPWRTIETGPVGLAALPLQHWYLGWRHADCHFGVVRYVSRDHRPKPSGCRRTNRASELPQSLFQGQCVKDWDLKADIREL